MEGCGSIKVVAEQQTKVYVCRVFYNSFEHVSTNQNQGPEVSILWVLFY